MRLVSVNVNGIRAAARRGGLDWLAGQRPDVLALQEVRASADQLRRVLARTPFADWELALHEGDQPGRAGVAVLSRYPLADRRGPEGLDCSVAAGRWVEADVRVAAAPGPREVTVLSAYVHTGEAGTPAQQDKYALLDAVDARLSALAGQGREAVLTGDLNICHTQQDLRNWRGNRGKAGFLPAEQAYLTRWQAAGWVDVVRRGAGEVDGPYTWWSWRGKAFDNDTGWRIDYQLATPGVASRVREWRVGRAPDYASRWSDHAPVLVDYALLP
ncbi:exodeoxyribonuclease III [Ornithinicoccus halotolerans]|uniref:exodeoxyribonuclease III n=1 Tax=Ornithinicoccus halotolerans TaxID=1748220 RepID=UPI001E374522|nr:exodeoxyribonuclease III [Ornithinicoccus halotolerans]